MARRERLFGLGLASLVALAGCTPVPADPMRTITDVTGVQTVDSGSVSGLTAVTLSEEDGRRRVFAGYPRIPGAEPLTAELAEAVNGQIRPFKAATSRTRGLPGGNVPELNVRWSLTAASHDVVGVRLLTDHYLGTSGGETRRTLWFDGRTGKVRSSAALIDGKAGLDALARAVRQRLGTETNPSRVTPDAFTSIAFNEQGDLVVEFSDYTVAPGSAGRVATAVPRAAHDGLLSDFGRRARDAAAAAPPDLALRSDTTTSGPVRGAPTPRPVPADCAKAKCVALTFDDGPGPYTGRVLDSLAAHRARATFFVVGVNAGAHPALLRRQAAEGHEIGNLTQNHRDLGRLPAMQVTTDVQRTDETVRAVIGRACTLLRPPYGSTNATVSQVARSIGMPQIRWDVDAGARAGDDPAAVADRVVADAGPGSVIRMHDVHRSSADAVPRILDRLERQGYTFVTVSELYAGRSLAPGAVYPEG
ncbi:polysaccharide deacetylase family protein [Spirillospora sp. NPDC047279]|uniref:polysaccharide deacetylase family protein n=1 Tax=Spirillospora sp. NPDC047279 TaxID=3155478 RepID=UPI00340EADE3